MAEYIRYEALYSALHANSEFSSHHITVKAFERQLNMPKFEIADPHTIKGQQRRAFQDSKSRGSAILKPPCYDAKFVDLLHISRLS